jgi:hypothetical protein
MAVHNNDLGCPARPRAAHGGIDLLGIQAAALLVERFACAYLLPAHNARNPFHVADDQDPHAFVFLCPWSEGFEEADRVPSIFLCRLANRLAERRTAYPDSLSTTVAFQLLGRTEKAVRQARGTVLPKTDR